MSQTNKAYRLIVRDLGLSGETGEALMLFLVEDAISRTSTPYSAARPNSPSVRFSALEQILGEDRAKRFLELEQHGHIYWEVESVRELLDRNDLPLGDRHIDNLVELFEKVDERLSDQQERIASNDSSERLRSRIHDRTEFERLALEVLPSVLTSEQVTIVYQQYRFLESQRLASMELQLRSRSDKPNEEIPFYVPVSSQ